MTSDSTKAVAASASPQAQTVRLAVVAGAWLAAYWHLEEFADFATSGLGLERNTRFGESVRFFLYDAPKILLLLAGITFILGVVHTFFTPNRVRALLVRRRPGAGNVLAAMLGIVTPFCSCSAVPMFIGFLSASVPLGVTFSFLASAPMVNEIALVLLFGMFGWKVAGLYLLLGLSIAIVAGHLIGRMKMEAHLEDWVRSIHADASVPAAEREISWTERLGAGAAHARGIVGKVWLYVLLGIAFGAGIHGYVPEDLLSKAMGRDAGWWSVPVAVLIGVPMYSSAAGIIPIIDALIGKGAAVGTVLAFMMSVIALSAPEMVILRRVLKPRLLATFVAIVTGGILIVGYVFNLVL